MAGRKKQSNRKAKRKKQRNRKAKPPPTQQTEVPEIEKKTAADKDHLSELPDDVLLKILSLPLLAYSDAVQTASVSRRWERLVAQLPELYLYLSLYEFTWTPRAMPSEQRAQSLARTLRRRCQDRSSHPVKKLHVFFRKDVAMECRCAEEFIALANATKLILSIQCARDSLPDDDAGAWSLQLPPATTELQVWPCWYAVRPPHIHGSAVDTLRSLTLVGQMVLRCQDFLVAAVLPALEDLHIGECSLAVGIDITSHAMPRLKHLRLADVGVMTDETKAAVNVLVDELTTLHMSCLRSSSTKPTTEPEMFFPVARYKVVFTTYSCFRLRAPKLRVFKWRCCYADEVRVESVGRLSDVFIEVAAGRKPTRFGQETVTVQQRDKHILRELMPGLNPRRWEDVKSKCKQHGDRWSSFEITSVYPLAE